MKKLTLMLLLVLSSLFAKAGLVGPPPIEQCIEYNATTGKFYLKATFKFVGGGYFDPLNAILGYPNQDNYVYLKAPGSSIWSNPYPFAYATYSGSGLIWTEYYDITTAGGYDENLCYEAAFITFDDYNSATGNHVDLATATSLHLDPLSPGKYPTVPAPGVTQYYIRHFSDATHHIYACKCSESQWPECDANFTFTLTYDTKYTAGSFLPHRMGDIFLNHPHAGSTYVYDWGDTYVSTLPSSHQYAPGNYTVCVTETTVDGKTCKSCVNICVDEGLSTHLSSTTPVPGTPIGPPQDTCDLDFKFVITYNSLTGGLAPGPRGDFYLPKHTPGSTYLYDWGDMFTSFAYPVSHFYTYGGSYDVCVTETKMLKPGQIVPSVCKTCLHICIDMSPSVSTARKVIENISDGNTGIGDNLIVSPNPTIANTELSFNMLQKDLVNITLVDMTGKTVLDVFKGTLEEGEQKILINTDNLSSGLYQIKMLIGNKLSTSKLSVIK